KVPDSDEDPPFNYTNFILGNIKYTDQYADQYGPYDPTRFLQQTTEDEKEPTAEPVQTKPATRSPVADIVDSASYDKEVVVQSDITVVATRDMVGAALYCRVEQNLRNGPKDLLRPMTAYVNLNITLGLLELELRGGEDPVSAGKNVRVECRAWGSNPPAEISWWKEGIPVASSVTAVMQGGNLTTSAVVIEATPKDNGADLTCQATNPVLRNSRLTKRRSLKVFYPPEVEIQMSEPALVSTVTEGADLVMICHAKSNPPSHDYKFYHQGAELTPSTGTSISGTTLTLRRVHRQQAGAYTCKATNLEGASLSPALHLTVLFAPVCAPGWGARTQGAAMGTTEAVACRVDAMPENDLKFSWYRLEHGGRERLITTKPVIKGLTSHITLTPLALEDFGTLMCKARNSIGKQLVGCRISIVPAGPPDPP
ncbi:CD80-like immunoglobulin C2-set, partial [Trinorchestia longiramus]